MARATAPAHSRHRMARAPRRLPAALAGPILLPHGCTLPRCTSTVHQSTVTHIRSARHFLMEVGGHRDEPATRQVEIGRWSGSTAQDVDLTPAQRLAWNHQLAAGVMPDNYAPLAKVQRVCRIIGDQLLALELLWEKHAKSGDRRFASLPVYGDFTVMKAWPAASADADDDDDVEA